MSRTLRMMFAVGLAAAVATGCGGENPYDAAENAPVATQPATDRTIVENVFLPEGENLSDCIGAVERPNCGSSAKGGWRQYTVMGVLVAGLAFVGWRISLGVRARDAVVNKVPQEPTP